MEQHKDKIFLNDGQNLLRKKLLSYFTEVTINNPQYSLRSFAKKLCISSSALSEILNSKRNVSAKKAKQLLIQICEPIDIIDNIVQAINEKKTIKRTDNEVLENTIYEELSLDYFKSISDWQYFAILSLVETVDFKNDYIWIAKRLGSSPNKIKKKIELLKKLEMLKEDKNNKLSCAAIQYSTPSDVANLAIRKNHHQSLDLAKEALDNVDVKLRDFSNVTMSINKNKIELAKKIIKNFRRKLTKTLESEEGGKHEVYKMAIQFFPLTKIENK